MNKINKNSGVPGENRPPLYEIIARLCEVISQQYGLSLSDIQGYRRGNNLSQACALFAGVLSSFEVPAGKIAQLLRKKTAYVEGDIAEYKHLVATSAKFRDMAKDVERTIRQAPKVQTL